MHKSVSPPASTEVDGLVFDHTRWDLIRLAADEDPADYARRQATRALNQLCEIYRGPVLAYLARRTVTPQDAEDLTQEFLARRIGPELFANTAAEKGRFRAWLLASLKNFVRDCSDRARAEKRGGHIEFVPLHAAAEASGDAHASDDLWFDACWAKTVVDRALERMRREFTARGEGNTYTRLLPFICERGEGEALSAAAAELGISLNALHIRLSRFRATYARYVRQELARTVTTPEEIEPEIRYLLDVLSSCR